MIQAADGTERRVDYVADQDGFRASVRSNEEGVAVGRSGADATFENTRAASNRVAKVVRPAKLRSQPRNRRI